MPPPLPEYLKITSKSIQVHLGAVVRTKFSPSQYPLSQLPLPARRKDSFLGLRLRLGLCCSAGSRARAAALSSRCSHILFALSVCLLRRQLCFVALVLLSVSVALSCCCLL